ncbi:hypothetical protein NDU88_001409 [Pleurodeles waltl]|uniref:Uncharacterized protein n=1 Tax=Pleurodeles waltl TaxID=8319 RepID=A0AAV7MSN6_PLEWA|nr:hypothetical protein NDU88_001409 [Pleurodeles waltl]
MIEERPEARRARGRGSGQPGVRRSTRRGNGVEAKGAVGPSGRGGGPRRDWGCLQPRASHWDAVVTCRLPCGLEQDTTCGGSSEPRPRTAADPWAHSGGLCVLPLRPQFGRMIPWDAWMRDYAPRSERRSR